MISDTIRARERPVGHVLHGSMPAHIQHGPLSGAACALRAAAARARSTP